MGTEKVIPAHLFFDVAIILVRKGRGHCGYLGYVDRLR